MRYLLIIAIVLFLNVAVKAQTKIGTIQALTIGDRVPDEIWNMPFPAANGPHESKTIVLNDYKAKIIILDFWATWCSSCIAAMPKTDALQKQLDDSICFLPVTYENKEKADSFLTHNKTIKDLKLFSIVNDSILKSLFPHWLIPHYVWIGENHTVMALTGPEELTIDNLRKVIRTKNANLTVKNDLDITKPLFFTADLQNNEIVHYTVLTKGYYSGLPGGIKENQKNGIIDRQAFYNSSILTLYTVTARHLFKEKGESFDTKRLIVDVSRPDKIDCAPSLADVDAWNKENLYNYDLTLQPGNAGNLYQYILEDLNRYLDYNGKIESRKAKYWALVLKDKTKNIPSGNNTSIKLSSFAKKINAMSFINIPVLDETNYQEEIRISLPVVKNIKSLNGELSLYNLRLIEGTRPIDMFILSDKTK